MILARQREAPRHAAAAAEFAVLLPVILLLLLGIWEVGRLVEVNQVLDNAAREGARQAATGQKTNSEVQLVVCNYLKNAGLPDYTSTKDTVVFVDDLDRPGTDVTAATRLERLRVRVTIPFKDVRWITLNLVTNPSSTLNAEANWRSDADAVYPDVVSSPPGF